MVVLWDKIGERGGAILTPNELVLPFGGFYVCANFGENRSINATVSRDCNPGLEFSIPGFGIVEFPISGSRDPVGIGGL